MRFSLSSLDLQRRVMLLAVMPCVVATMLLTSYFTIDKIRTLEDGFTANGGATAKRLASYSDLSLYAGDIGALRRVSQDAIREPGVQSVQISNGAGLLVTAHRNGPVPAQTRGFSAAVRIRPTGSFDDWSVDDDDGGAGAVGNVRVVIDSSGLYRQELRSAITGLLIGLATLIAAMWGATLLARGIAAPLRQLGVTVAAIRAGDLNARSRLDSDDELGRLSAGIDDMAAALAGHHSELEARVREAQLQAQQRLSQAEQANAAKARFLAAASHDLRQPLHAVGLFVGKLRETAGRDQLALVERIDEGLSGMSGLLTALLDISRLDAGVVEPQRSVVSIGKLFDDAEATLSSLAIERETRLLFRRRDLHVDVDPALSARILSNFVENALRYAAGGAVLVSAQRHGDKVRVQVRDNGIGIASMYHERVFEEFFQLDNPERDRRKGLGLGLAICARAARLLDIRIGLESAVGKGSCFYFDLPAAERPAPVVAAAPAMPTARAQGRALVVDDDRAIRDGTIGLIEQWGLTTVAASTVDEAVEALVSQGSEFDYLLCDLQLSEVDDGWRVIEAARRIDARTRLLLVSGDTSAATLRRARENGVVLLTKPVTPAKLRAALGPVGISPSGGTLAA
ncbi:MULTISPECIES: hybrid sensor histidine kinase/response regulator [Hydrocarboniphaga]|jgi:signal transduction histidine kinase|nr:MULTISPECIES: hybrid sensor histidine kinase/response regulator [Hydrocarboniphaga]MDZ4080651.1 hybrid sensor histidine kinase/response regulator [Hydrocarboniphaga sp.]